MSIFLFNLIKGYYHNMLCKMLWLYGIYDQLYKVSLLGKTQRARERKLEAKTMVHGLQNINRIILWVQSLPHTPYLYFSLLTSRRASSRLNNLPSCTVNSISIEGVQTHNYVHLHCLISFPIPKSSVHHWWNLTMDMHNNPLSSSYWTWRGCSGNATCIFHVQ